MDAYRWSVRLKLGLIVFAVCIAVASLWYTQRLVNRLQKREQAVIQLWAEALEQVVQTRQASNPHRQEFRQPLLQQKPCQERLICLFSLLFYHHHHHHRYNQVERRLRLPPRLLYLRILQSRRRVSSMSRSM